ncbi:MAG: FAD:protein FMN transferase [Bdellovibrionia bacterium]
MNGGLLRPALFFFIALTPVFFALTAYRTVDRCPKNLHIPSMGTVFEIQYLTSCGPDSVGPAIKAKLDRWEASMSLYQSESEISRLNRYGILEDPSADFLKLLSISIGHSQATKGYFEITVWPVLQLIKTNFKTTGKPPRAHALEMLKPLVDSAGIELSRQIRFKNKGVMITLDGIAKGFAVDEIGRWLRAAGISNFLINFSGNMLAGGYRADEKPWTVGIPNPVTGETTTIELHDEAIASSGVDYSFYSKDKKWHHLINPRTLRPANGAVATTIVGPSATTCDVLSTATFALGSTTAAKILAENYPKYRYWIYEAPKNEISASN